ncbi:bifunctional glutamate N-acetyltransferase/amino-acid acetyltransferase ArgJ [Trueperella sp. LYQ143]|uniref:bifunctional glutamate N-acetyltransferase/amino-acid acetyltransferase ArgJ n=1 Tax=unclassified Trueperella TaxID=2630174 RepID=UPI003982FF4E
MGVTAARGFRAAGIAAGIKTSGALDLAVIVNDGPQRISSCVLTSNRVYAAPVQWMKDCAHDELRAVVLNSGGANAATGERGYRDTQSTAQCVADLLECPVAQIGVCSTGMIGEYLPMPRVLSGVQQAMCSLSPTGGQAAARAIMTTDTRPKQAGVTGAYTIGGMAKGAGMLAPALATMLCVITTDAVIDRPLARRALSAAVAQSFNCIDSDGAMSTNDTVILMSSGASGKAPGSAAEFIDELTAVCQSLARQLIADAEGASHDIHIQVNSASSRSAAQAVARAVSRSNLVKAAIFGNDPNWGRVISQVGTVPEDVAPFDPQRLDVWFNGVQVCRNGAAHAPRDLVDLASQRDVEIVIDLHAGEHCGQLWTNDLTHAYVEENSAYSS